MLHRYPPGQNAYFSQRNHGSNPNMKIKNQSKQKKNYLLVKDIPAQKLQAQRKRAHFLGIRFLEANSPPVLLKDIFPPKSSLVPHLTISLQNENGNK